MARPLYSCSDNCKKVTFFVYIKRVNRQAPVGFEPITSCLLDRRSNQLSYGALCEAMAEQITVVEGTLTRPTFGGTFNTGDSQDEKHGNFFGEITTNTM